MELLTIEEVAERLRTNVETVRHWRKAGTAPKGVKIGRRVLFPAAGVEEWLKERLDAA